ncbi:MAG: hypothetical protein A2033_03900 [Bacteroidetes bacterium GWA2_31_9]|nr:MAG: hypothetical protein A2033_03900 [Bacteroidetes bacterium GWA2_31_9]
MNMNCFVIMPFSAQYDGIWKSVIEPTILNRRDICVRADNIFSTSPIIDDIINSINDADYIVADLSVQNPNVYYELGYAHALQKKVILITQDISLLPFDLKHQRVILYKDSASGAQDLIKQLNLFIDNL